MSVPTIAFAIPPPASPTGRGVWVRNATLMFPAPWLTTYPRTSSKTTMIMPSAATHRPIMSVFRSFRCHGIEDTLFTDASPSATAVDRDGSIDLPDEKSRDCVDHDRHPEKDQTNLDQRREVEIGCRLGELVCDDRRQRVTRCEQRSRNRRSVSDYHRHRHGFAERAPETQDDSPDDPGARVRNHRALDHFPARGAKCQ